MVKKSKKSKDEMKEDFMEMLKKDLVCPICLDIFQNPVLDKCGHIFCKKCILIHLKTKETCPLNNEIISGSPFRKIFLINNFLEKIKFECSTCKKKISYNETKKIKRHKKNCLKRIKFQKKTKEELINKLIDYEENAKISLIDKFVNDIIKKKIYLKKLKNILHTEIVFFSFNEKILFFPKINNIEKYYSGYLFTKTIGYYSNLDTLLFFKKNVFRDSFLF